MLAVLVTITGCKKESFPIPKIEATAQLSSNTSDETLLAPKKNVEQSAIQIVVLDRTIDIERPAGVKLKLSPIMTKAAQAAGFTISAKGLLAGVEVHYALVKDKKMLPVIDRGLLTWTVLVTLRIEDDMGLAEDFKGASYGEAPYVSAAVPDLNMALREVISSAATHAFLDVNMQKQYRNCDVACAMKGMDTNEPEELWAAMRRLGELKSVEAVPKVIELAVSGRGVTAAVAMGVLARIKDPRALGPLADAAREENITRAYPAIEALFAFGTPQALKLVQKIGKNHPLESIQKLVQQFLKTRQSHP